MPASLHVVKTAVTAYAHAGGLLVRSVHAPRGNGHRHQRTQRRHGCPQGLALLSLNRPRLTSPLQAPPYGLDFDGLRTYLRLRVCLAPGAATQRQIWLSLGRRVAGEDVRRRALPPKAKRQASGRDRYSRIGAVPSGGRRLSMCIPPESDRRWFGFGREARCGGRFVAGTFRAAYGNERQDGQDKRNQCRSAGSPDANTPASRNGLA
jgi:hypothetical protein